MSMITVDDSLVKNGVVNLPMKEYLELLRDATGQDNLIKAIKKDIKIEVKHGYAAMTQKVLGLEFLRELVVNTVLNELRNSPETVAALCMHNSKYFDVTDLTFTEYRWYNEEKANKIALLEDEVIRGYWSDTLAQKATLDLIRHYDADQLGELIAALEHYKDESKLEENVVKCNELIDALQLEEIHIPLPDIRWLEMYGFVKLAEIEDVKVEN